MSKKFGVVDTYYSILTSGPLAGRPCYFVKLDNTASRDQYMSMKKLGKRINKECATFMVHLSGRVYNEVLLTWLLDNNFVVVVDVLSSQPIPDNFDWSLFESKLVSPHVTVNTERIHEELAKTAFIFRYKISKIELLDTDGLPKGLYRSEQMLRITLAPSVPSATERAVQICKRYGYYLGIDYHTYIGIR